MRLLWDWLGKVGEVIMPILTVAIFLYVVLIPEDFAWYWRTVFATNLFLMGGIYLPKFESWIERKADARAARRSDRKPH